MKTRMFLILNVAMLLAACGGIPPEPEGTSDDALASSESDLNQQCYIGCPSGYHPTKYYCSLCGGSSCFASYDSTECQPNTPSFNKCDVGGCPPGYIATQYYCDYNCFMSPGHACGSGTTNATTCVAQPAITSITNASYGYAFYRGQALIVWGSRFTPNGSTVYLTQNGTWWRMPYYDATYWWNGNDSQINTIIPTALSAGYVDVQVEANGVVSSAYRIYVN